MFFFSMFSLLSSSNSLRRFESSILRSLRFSVTIQNVQNQARDLWRYQRFLIVNEYSKITPLPSPFNSFYYLFYLCRFLLRRLRRNRTRSRIRKCSDRFNMIHRRICTRAVLVAGEGLLSEIMTSQINYNEEQFKSKSND